MPNPSASTSSTPAAGQSGVTAGWDPSWSVVNLRGNPDDPEFRAGVARALGVELPVAVCSTHLARDLKLVWVGPDDWFVMSRQRQAAELEAALRAELAGQHFAVTDVSSNYTLLHLSGPRVRELLAQGCPLDLHPRAFRTGQSAGSVFFKASIWLWQTDDSPTYEVLVRNSFRGYVWLMLEQCSAENGLVKRVFA
jgi:sarcosine oxidase, subunit gamma